jgi:hypothetical protein
MNYVDQEKFGYIITNAGVQLGDFWAPMKALSGEAGSNPDRYSLSVKKDIGHQWLECQSQRPKYWAALQDLFGELQSIKGLVNERTYTDHEKFQLLLKQVQVVFPRIHTKYLNKLDTDAPLTLKSMVTAIETQRQHVGLGHTVVNPKPPKLMAVVNQHGFSGHDYSRERDYDGNAGGPGGYGHDRGGGGPDWKKQKYAHHKTPGKYGGRGRGGGRL